MPDPENMGFAFRIVFLSGPLAEMLVLPVYVAAIFDFQFPLTSNVVYNSTVGEPDHVNMLFALLVDRMKRSYVVVGSK